MVRNEGSLREHVDVVAHKEKLVGGVAIVGRVKDAIVAHEGLEVKPVLGMTLDPAVPQISTFGNATAMYTTHLIA